MYPVWRRYLLCLLVSSFVSLTELRSFNKQYIETKIAEHGGTFVQNPTTDTYCVLVHKLVVKANNIISKGIYNVVMIQWLLDCLETGRCLPLKPSLMYSTSSETASKFSEVYDKYGDSYIDDTSETTLREIFDKMKDKRSCSADEIAKIELEYFPNESDNGLFRHFK
ncbi:PREDICTED: DNA ligase 4-like [Amphimedon queenslandica]|uniref:BRCT domain-containing protein n=1 Tax=Amphimedon queenslandica TaxID=400682 RepID=A0A1X7SLN0_AMPQE|nr:PREDICTED: DNA ligase 4-like [Amphimedon queenslandica]|eukprot:XP_003391902.2 PREDICTED: DNA ligase 4-like [Amphimedon queenslandica]